jgi:hypothetical protein
LHFSYKPLNMSLFIFLISKALPLLSLPGRRTVYCLSGKMAFIKKEAIAKEQAVPKEREGFQGQDGSYPG